MNTSLIHRFCWEGFYWEADLKGWPSCRAPSAFRRGNYFGPKVVCLTNLTLLICFHSLGWKPKANILVWTFLCAPLRCIYYCDSLCDPTRIFVFLLIPWCSVCIIRKPKIVFKFLTKALLIGMIIADCSI
jgi:hypothetical protein